MTCTGHEKEVVNQLLHDSATPLKIRFSVVSHDSKDSKDPEDSKHSESTCHIPRSLLASVSPKLVDTCSRGLRLDHVSEDVIRMFVTWLLYRKLDVAEDEDDESGVQTRLAQAWNFGAEYEIPAFQNKVMRRLINLLGLQRVHSDAVVEAYRPRERGSLLQKAFTQHLAADIKEEVEGICWTREDFTSCTLGADSQFLLDVQFADIVGGIDTFLSSTPVDG